MIYGAPQFYGVRASAANIGQSKGNYTAEQFQQDFPQFFTPEGVSLVPETMLSEIINMANACVQPDKWLVCGSLRHAVSAPLRREQPHGGPGCRIRRVGRRRKICNPGRLQRILRHQRPHKGNGKLGRS